MRRAHNNTKQHDPKNQEVESSVRCPHAASSMAAAGVKDARDENAWSEKETKRFFFQISKYVPNMLDEPLIYSPNFTWCPGWAVAIGAKILTWGELCTRKKWRALYALSLNMPSVCEELSLKKCSPWLWLLRRCQGTQTVQNRLRVGMSRLEKLPRIWQHQVIHLLPAENQDTGHSQTK